MPYTHNIRIDNIPVTDLLAKIVCLSLLGLSYSEIEKVLTLAEGTVRNEISRHYGLFTTPHCINALNFLALQYGFNFKGQANGIQLLCDYEQHRLHKLVPRTGNYRQLELQFK
jgi:hypothetical protein